jgi:hypothetical protein
MSSAKKTWTLNNQDKVKASQKKWYENNKSYFVERRKNKHGAYYLSYKKSVWQRYGIDIEEALKALREHDGLCALCGTAKPGRRDWSVDHCHETLRVRGILCNTCNLSLGHYEKILRLPKLKSYLHASKRKAGT